MVISELLTEAYYDGDVDDAVASEDDSDYFEFDDDTDNMTQMMMTQMVMIMWRR